MILWELFSGTGYVGNVAASMGFEIISVDRDLPATFKCDIMSWDYTMYPTKYFDVIWMSPPCTEYSKALTTRPRKIDEANSIVERALLILEYFEPRFWMIENPQTGLLKNQFIMHGYPYKDVDYCKYGMPYRKRTRIWNNVFQWEPRQLCKKDCGKCVGNKHVATAQRMPSGRKETWGDRPEFKQEDLYRVPEELIREIFECIVWSRS